MRIGGQIDIVGGIASDFCTWVTMTSITVYFLYAMVTLVRQWAGERAARNDGENTEGWDTIMNIMNTDTNKITRLEELEVITNAPIVVGHEMSWDEFRNLVDRVITRKIGLGIDDLPDTIALDDYWSEDLLSSREWFSRAKEAAAEVLEYAGYEEEGMED